MAYVLRVIRCLSLLFISRVSVDAELCAVMYLVNVFRLRFFYISKWVSSQYSVSVGDFSAGADFDSSGSRSPQENRSQAELRG